MSSSLVVEEDEDEDEDDEEVVFDFDEIVVVDEEVVVALAHATNPALAKSIDNTWSPNKWDRTVDSFVPSPKTEFAESQAKGGIIFTFSLMKCFGVSKCWSGAKIDEDDDNRFLRG